VSINPPYAPGARLRLVELTPALRWQTKRRRARSLAGEGSTRSAVLVPVAAFG
jgi:hypothetical protein